MITQITQNTHILYGLHTDYTKYTDIIIWSNRYDVRVLCVTETSKQVLDTSRTLIAVNNISQK